ncbi:MAG: hypothetical protein ACR5LA_05505 [Wolbachia sp.]
MNKNGQRVTLESRNSVKHWDDKKEALALGWKPVSATFMTSFTMSIL